MACLAATVSATHVSGDTPVTPRQSVAFSHADLDSVLVRYLRAGRVDYAGLAADRAHLDGYLERVAQAALQSWSRDEQFAFWVNAYNARVLAQVIDRPGLRSVLDVGKILGIPTLAFFRQKRMTAGSKRSLNEIEHSILREQFRDPRVHFVLNCASASCPELPRRALTAANLDSMLQAATMQFLRDGTRNRISPPDTLQLSQIFKWYREDFEVRSGSVQTYIESYLPRAREFDPSVTVRYLDYDWSLNGSW